MAKNAYRRLSIKIVLITLLFVALIMGICIWYVYRHNAAGSVNPIPVLGTRPPGYYNYGEPLGCVKNGSLDCEHQSGSCPICLSENDLISTASGQVQVTKLKVGDKVWTEDNEHRQVLAPIIKLVHREVPEDFSIVKVGLVSGKAVLASPNHPTVDGRTIGSLKVGDILDGSPISSVQRVTYRAHYTYDLLPDSDGLLLGQWCTSS